MQQEKTHFSRVFNNLQLIVEDLRMRMRGLLGEQRGLKETLEAQDEAKRQFKE